MELLRSALDTYRGDVFLDEPDASWAIHFRREIHDTFLRAAYLLAASAVETGDHLTRVDAYRRVLHVDPYEQRAHAGLIEALGAYGQAAEAEAEYEQCMSELGIDTSRVR